MGSNWLSKEGKNLTFSVLKNFNTLDVSKQFGLNMSVSLALHKVLSDLNIPELQVKWPNDILSGSHKICGILIENVLTGNTISKTIIGIGLNVNQLSFGDLTKASSLSKVTGNTFDLDVVLESILEKLKYFLDTLEDMPTKILQNHYEAFLFRKGKVSTFLSKEGSLFSGIIRGVSPEGRLIVEMENGNMNSFYLKEITLVY